MKDRKELLSDFADWLQLNKAKLLKIERPTEDLLLKAFALWLHLPTKRASLQDIEAHCPKVDESFKGQNVLLRNVSVAQVVLCTLNTSGSSFLRKALYRKFDTLFLDEAAQVSICSCISDIPANAFLKDHLFSFSSVRKQSST